MFLPAIASIAGAALGGIFGNEAADKQADATVQSNREAIELQREQFDWIKEQMQPSITRGNAAADLYGASFGLTPMSGWSGTPSAGGSQTGGTNTGSVWDAYYNNYPGLQETWQTNTFMQNAYPTRDAFLEAHWNTHGQREGRTRDAIITPNGPTAGLGRDLTGLGGTTDEPRTNALSGLTEGDAASYQEQAYDRFLGSGYNQAATDITSADIDTIRGGMGAAGKLLSGSAAGAMSDRLAGNRYGAYFDYQNALSGLAGAGQSATSAVGAAGQNYAGNAGNALMNIGDARASSYGQQYQNTSNALGNIAGSLGGFF